MSSVVRLSVKRGYCDKTGEARIMRFCLKVAQCRNSLPDYKIRWAES